MEKQNLLSIRPAAGVIFIEKLSGNISIKPVVWVRDIQTIFYETACASGSTAVGLLMALQKNSKRFKQKIRQPSGKYLTVTIKKDFKKFTYAEIEGPIKLLEKAVTRTSNKVVRFDETKITFSKLLSVKTKTFPDLLVRVNPKTIPNGYIKSMSDMTSISGTNVIVRKTVYKKLQGAQKILQKSYPNYTLYLTYGYRSIEIQTGKFLDMLKNTQQFFPNPIDLYEEVHRFIAVPAVAGHPTGGAVDIIIKSKKTKEVINFGGKQYDFSTKNCNTFFPNITEKAKQNRLLLRKIMMQVGFAPFDGEWWHFSYGDREWAYYYKKPYALYEQVSYTDVIKRV